MRITRRLVQFGFLGLTLVGVFVLQGHAERWCPFGGVEGLYTYSTQGNLTCSLGVSNFYILGGALLATLLLRRAFCGYACPLGTLGEWLQAGARRLGVRPLRVPYRLDRALALLKYGVLAAILYFTWTINELVFRGYDPCYVLISRHGEDIKLWAYLVTGGLALLSLLFMVPLCRWLCPLAAVFTPFSRLGLTRIHRDATTCTDCGKCARVCPMGIRVDKVAQVTAARCTACLECVAACPLEIQARRAAATPAATSVATPAKATRGGTLRWGPPRWLGGRWPQAVLVVLLLACLGGAVAATYKFPLPSFVHVRGTRPAQTSSVSLNIFGVKCRESALSLAECFERRDEYAVAGYVRVEAWPAPEIGRVRIIYDPTTTTALGIQRAIAMPTFDLVSGAVQRSTFRIEGLTVDELLQ
jgi:polyferredoxin